MSSKTLNNRLLRIERLKGTEKFLIGVQEPGFYHGIKVNGVLLTEKQFRNLQETSEYSEVFLISIIENKPVEKGAK